MKTLMVKATVASILLAFFAMSSFGQATKNTTDAAAKSKAKIAKTKVPKEVTSSFYVDYPVTTYENWYDYPAFDYSNDWIDDYPYYYSDYPENYVVEFTANNTPAKTIYSKAGKKIATHKAVNSIPQAISTAIINGQYKTWKVGKDKEEIFKDTDKDQMKVYKVNVLKGTEKHTLYFQPDGKLLKDKKVS